MSFLIDEHHETPIGPKMPRRREASHPPLFEDRRRGLPLEPPNDPLNRGLQRREQKMRVFCLNCCCEHTVLALTTNMSKRIRHESDFVRR